MKLDTEFFYNNATRAHRPDSPVSKFDQWWAGAEDLRVARERALVAGYTFDWSQDGLTNREWTNEGPEYMTWVCEIFTPIGHVCGSLGGIDLGENGSPYNEPHAKVCEAELALEYAQ